MVNNKKIKTINIDRNPLKSDTVRDVMDIKALASYLSLGKSKIYTLIREKKIPASRIGRQYRFSKSIVDQWLSEKLITNKEDSQISLFNKESDNNTEQTTFEN